MGWSRGQVPRLRSQSVGPRWHPPSGDRPVNFSRVLACRPYPQGCKLTRTCIFAARASEDDPNRRSLNGVALACSLESGVGPVHPCSSQPSARANPRLFACSESVSPSNSCAPPSFPSPYSPSAAPRPQRSAYRFVVASQLHSLPLATLGVRGSWTAHCAPPPPPFVHSPPS